MLMTMDVQSENLAQPPLRHAITSRLRFLHHVLPRYVHHLELQLDVMLLPLKDVLHSEIRLAMPISLFVLSVLLQPQLELLRPSNVLQIRSALEQIMQSKLLLLPLHHQLRRSADVPKDTMFQQLMPLMPLKYLHVLSVDRHQQPQLPSLVINMEVEHCLLATTSSCLNLLMSPLREIAQQLSSAQKDAQTARKPIPPTL